MQFAFHNLRVWGKVVWGQCISHARGGVKIRCRRGSNPTIRCRIDTLPSGLLHQDGGRRLLGVVHVQAALVLRTASAGGEGPSQADRGTPNRSSRGEGGGEEGPVGRAPRGRMAARGLHGGWARVLLEVSAPPVRCYRSTNTVGRRTRIGVVRGARRVIRHIYVSPFLIRSRSVVGIPDRADASEPVPTLERDRGRCA